MFVWVLFEFELGMFVLCVGLSGVVNGVDVLCVGDIGVVLIILEGNLIFM